MNYNVVLSERAKKELKKLDPFVAKKIKNWMRENLENCEDPRKTGKGLTSNLSGLWRYRVGDYRIIADIRDNKVIIVVIDIVHRSEAYSKKKINDLPL